MDTKTLIQMFLDAGGSEFKTTSGSHTRIDHFFGLSIDELIKFESAIRKHTCDEASKRTDESHVKEMLGSIANGY